MNMPEPMESPSPTQTPSQSSYASVYTRPHFASLLGDRTLSTIVECGARDCADSVQLLETYRPDRVFALECNPECLT